MDEANSLLQLIDRRILDVLNKQNIVCRTPAFVQAVIEKQPYAQVEFFGDPNHEIHTFPYKRNCMTIIPGDTVYIEHKIGDINSGIIVEKLFGATEDFEGWQS